MRLFKRAERGTDRGGATLIELMVACALFAGILACVLSFYVYATHLSKRQEAISEGYRSAMLHLDKLEALLGMSRVYGVERDGTVVIFEPGKEVGGAPTIARRWPQFSGRLASIFVDNENGRVIRRDNGGTVTLFRLPFGEKISFTLAGRVLTIQLEGGKNPDSHRSFSLSREVILENPVTL